LGPFWPPPEDPPGDPPRRGPPPARRALFGRFGQKGPRSGRPRAPRKIGHRIFTGRGDQNPPQTIATGGECLGGARAITGGVSQPAPKQSPQGVNVWGPLRVRSQGECTSTGSTAYGPTHTSTILIIHQFDPHYQELGC